MKRKTILANRSNYGGKRKRTDIRYIVIHYTANDGDSAEANGRYFQTRVTGTSAHYFVDNTDIVLSVPEESTAWAVGGRKYPSADSTGGGKWFGKCTNKNSISIELCDTMRDGKYDFSEKTLANAALLCRELMQKYHVPLENVIRHFDVVGKICPAPFVENAAAWQAFRERLGDEMVEMVQVEIDGKIVDVEGIQKTDEKGNATNFIKLRVLAEMLGYEVSSRGSMAVLRKKE